MNNAPIVSYNAIPSILIVAPIGAINWDTFGLTPILLRHFIVIGTVAVLKNYFAISIIYLTVNAVATCNLIISKKNLEDVPRAVMIAGPVFSSKE